MKYGRILLLVLAVAALAAVGSELGRGADVARSAPAADDVDISLDNVTILGADTDGNENTIEIPTCDDKVNIPQTVSFARIVKEITIRVPILIRVRVSGEFKPPNYTFWHCMLPFVAGANALTDQGCTVGSPSYSVLGSQPPFRGLPECQWTWTTQPPFPAGAHKVVMPWLRSPYLKCERFVNYSTLVAVAPPFQASGPAPGCRVNEVSAAAWVPPTPGPNPYDIGDCILDWHKYFWVVRVGTIKIRVVDGLELKPADIPVGLYDMSEDIEVLPEGYTDPNLTDNGLTVSFKLNIVPTAPVGGLAELPGVSGSSGLNYVALAGLAAAAVVALGASGWYARRRWGR
jgi:hypothetical protein